MSETAAESKGQVLLFMQRADGTDRLVTALTRLGFGATVADSAVGLQEAMRKSRRFHAVYLDLKLEAARALQVMLALRKALPPTCIIYLSRLYLDALAAARFEKAGVIRTQNESDPALLAAALVAPPPPAPVAKPAPKIASYDVNIVNCFVSTTSDVLEYYMGEKPTGGKAGVVATKKTPLGYATAVADFTGTRWHGTALLTCEHSFIVDIAARVNGTSRSEAESDQEGIVATLEMLADQIFGKAELLLGRIGYEVAMGSPTIHVGTKDRVVIAAAGPVMLVPFVLAKKRFFIGFSLTAQVRAG